MKLVLLKQPMMKYQLGIMYSLFLTLGMVHKEGLVEKKEVGNLIDAVHLLRVVITQLMERSCVVIIVSLITLTDNL